MALREKLKNLSNDVNRKLNYAKKEATTRSYLVDPFIEALGYSVNDPEDVEQEFTADIGKQGERVDYAIKLDRSPIIFIEVKSANTSLSNNHASQLRRYYGTKTNVRLSILTNGLEYRFFADLEKPNVMDDEPFMVMDIRLLHDWQIEELRAYTKTRFDLDQVLSAGRTLKYKRRLQCAVKESFDPLSDEVIELLIRRVYSGNLTQSMRDKLTPLVEQSWQEFIQERRGEPEPEPEPTPLPPIPPIVTSDDRLKIAVFANYKGHRFEADLLYCTSKPKQSTVRYGDGLHKPSRSTLVAMKTVNPTLTNTQNGWSFWKLSDPNDNRERPIGDLRKDTALLQRLKG